MVRALANVVTRGSVAERWELATPVARLGGPSCRVGRNEEPGAPACGQHRRAGPTIVASASAIVADECGQDARAPGPSLRSGRRARSGLLASTALAALVGWGVLGF